MANKSTKRSIEEKKKKKKEAERKRRERIKADPVKYEAFKSKEKERRRKRKDEKKTLTINDLTPRQQRDQRKQWRERAKISRENKKLRKRLLVRLREDTPPSDVEQQRGIAFIQEQPPRLSSPQRSQSETADMLLSPSSSIISRQKIIGQKISKKNRNMREQIIRKQRQTIDSLKRAIHTLKVKIGRVQNTSIQRYSVQSKSIYREYQKKRIDVQTFLENDDNSTLCPGKKDTITRLGKKKQKRLLCDTLENLHKKYNKDRNKNISYTTFTRFRPFWIVQPKVTARDTCLCVFHENFKFMIEKLRHIGIIKEKSAIEVCESVTCSQYKYKCMNRLCNGCSQKVPNFQTFDNTENILYKQWVTKKETRMIKGREKVITRTVKDSIECSKKELVEKFLGVLPRFLIHTYNISHQYKSVTYLRKQLRPGEALLHIDFSENFQCKYAAEAQAVHFGASRQQISMHTCVLYYRDARDYEDGAVKIKSFCSVSECLRHDAAAIYAHLLKSLKQVFNDFDIKIKTLHILSDGPCAQYKNKTNFYLFTQHLVNMLGITRGSWNFSEAGHGKGAADGVGGAIKRIAHNLVALGKDIPDFNTFLTIMLENTNIALYPVMESDITDADYLVPKVLKTIPETKKVHQITWSRENPRTIYLRGLSCTICPLTTKCIHYAICNGRFDYMTSRERLMEAGTSNNLPGVNSQYSSNNENLNVANDLSLAPHNNYLLAPEDVHHSETQFTGKGPDTVKEGSWVVVRFEGKKSATHFVGQVLSIEKKSSSFVVKYLRKKNIELGLFTWYEPEDVSSVDVNDIVQVLPEPSPTRRSELSFNFDFLKLKYVFK